MRIRGFRQGCIAHPAAVVTAALLAVGTPAAWAGPAASARPSTALEVQSEPAGAAVYVDGQLKGETPVSVEGIGSGDHRVRVVKDGFLENSRTVSVPASGRSLRVALTPTRTPVRAAMQAEPGEPKESGGGGGGKKWIFIGLGAVLTAGGVGVYLATKGDKASVDSVTASGTTGILQGATPVKFGAKTTGDSLKFSWDFGDGQTSTDASPIHVFQAAGTHTIVLTVTDSGNKTASGSTVVTVGSLAGSWRGQILDFSFTCNLRHSGPNVGGSCSSAWGVLAITGSVRAPRKVDLTVSHAGFYPWYMEGGVSDDLNSITGRTSGLVDSAGRPARPDFRLVRQQTAGSVF